MHRNAFYKGRSTLVTMVTTAAFRGLGPHFHAKTSQKRVKCLFLYLKLNATLQIGTSIIHSDIIRLYFDLFNFPWE